MDLTISNLTSGNLAAICLELDSLLQWLLLIKEILQMEPSPTRYVCLKRLQWQESISLKELSEFEKYVRNNELPDCEPDNFFCPFNQYHDKSESKLQTTLVKDETQLSLIRQYNQRSADIKLLQTDQRHLKELILKSFPIGQYNGGGFNWSITKIHKDEYTVQPHDYEMLSVKVDK